MKVDLKDTYITVVGRRGCGKTTVVQWLVRSYKHLFKEVFVISPSSFSGAWDDLVPKENVYQEWKEDWADRLITKMGLLNRGKTKNSPGFTRVLVILDDLLSSDAKAHHSKAMKVFAARGRHLGLSVLNVVHNLKSISPMMRMSSDLLVIGKQNSASNMILYEEFGGPNGMDKKEFDGFVRRNTDNYQFLVVCNTASNTSDDDDVFSVIKAPNTTA